MLSLENTVRRGPCKVNSTSSLVKVATKSREIVRGKQAVSLRSVIKQSGRRKLASEIK